MTKSKTICINMFLVAFCVISVNAMELGDVRGAINDIKANNTDIVLPAAKPSKSDNALSLNSKIYVTPVTANWANAMLLKFIKGTDINTVMHVLRKAGLQSETFADNGDGFYVRVDVENNLAPQKAVLLSLYSVVESVQVNNTVYNLIKNSSGKSMKEAQYSKIYVTPVTANWANAMLLKFIKGTDINTVMHVLKKAGLQSETFADNGNGFYVRVDVENNLAPQKAVLLSLYSVVESVQVNNTVYNLIKNSSGKMAKGVNGPLQDISYIMSSQKLPGCSVYKNNYHSNDPWDDSLSLTIVKNGEYMDMLLAEETVEYSLVKENKVFKYELISTDGPDTVWMDYRVKDVFEFHTDKNNKPTYLKMKKYKEVKNIFGSVRWKELDSMICK